MNQCISLRLFATILVAAFAVCCARVSAQDESRPNIILIFTDDQGYQDLGCFGSKTIKTPHLDQMAAEGVRLTSFYAQPVCGVSRAALLTASYPIRIAEPANMKLLHTVPHPKEMTMAEVLKKTGYATGMIGKWHLALDRRDLPSGVGPATMPNAQGFDYFYGTPKFNGFTVYVNDTKMRSPIMRNKEVVVEAVESWDHITADYTDDAVKWIKSNRDKPFFLYLAHNMPHIPLGASEKFKGKSAGGFYGDTIEEIDWSCGEIFKTLKELGIDDNTLVVFTSDNGPWVETTRGMEPGGEAFIPRAHSGNADPLRGWKMSAWDGGCRVPFIARWPGKIPAGWESDELLSTMDLLPTFAGFAKAPLPKVELDGRDASEFLTRKSKTSPRDEYLYYSGCLLTGVRSGQWKLVLPRDKAPEGLGWWGRMIEAVPETLLFNLDSDPGETTNVASDHPDVVASLMKRIEDARTELGDIDQTGSGARFFDEGPRKLQVPVKTKPAERKAAVVDPAELYRSTIPQDKNLDAEWVQSLTERGHALDRGIRGSKKDDSLKYIGMPVGGVGCGTAYLSGDGRLYVWDIWNKGQRGVIAQDIPVPRFTFADTLEEQKKQLADNPLLQRFRKSREKILKDPHHPIFHFTSPENRLNDPNGLSFWKGQWHMFYQGYPPEHPRQHWGHAISDDLIHWRDLPYAIYPDPERACFSGSVFVEEDRAIAMYHGTEVGTMVAVSDDPLLLNWEKVTGKAVIPYPRPGELKPSYNIFDPCIWKKGDWYFALTAGPKGGKQSRSMYLHRSKDLTSWEHLHEFLENDRFGLVGDDGACPYFWPIGDKHILLHFSHMSGGKYMIGDYDTKRDKFVVDDGGDFNFGAWGPCGLHAPSAYPDGNGGVVVIFNVNQGKPTKGWDRMMSLPRRLTLRKNAVFNPLNIEPAGDVESLRGEHVHVGPMDLPANQEIVLEKVKGNAMELIAEVAPQNGQTIELNVLRSPDGAEVTRIQCFRDRGLRIVSRKDPPTVVSIDSSRSTTAGDVLCRPPETAQVDMAKNEPLTLRVFIDRSIVEVFVNGRQCVTVRVYPDRKDSLGVSLRAQGKDARLLSLDAWQMRSVWPELKFKEAKQ